MAHACATVAVILDPNFGDRADELAAAQPVWLSGSIENRKAAERLWAAKTFPLDQVTMFDVDEAAPNAKSFVDILDAVDMHHAAWRRLHVIGVELTPFVKSALAEYGDGIFEETLYGFIFVRTSD